MDTITQVIQILTETSREIHASDSAKTYEITVMGMMIKFFSWHLTHESKNILFPQEANLVEELEDSPDFSGLVM